MCPIVDNSSEAVRQLRPVQAVPGKQFTDGCEPKLLRVHDRPQPLSVYDDMATRG
jgi:hypothetical protein